jgi:uncharacterized protein (DUF1810 family)
MSDLDRFIAAQDRVFAAVLAELRAGRKLTHWMWFVFPQLAALGRSPTAKFYGLAGLDDARAYMDHPVLGPRLLLCTRLVNAIEQGTAHDIFGSPDDFKFRSSITLFHHAAPQEGAFAEALRKYYGRVDDPLTVELLARA